MSTREPDESPPSFDTDEELAARFERVIKGVHLREADHHFFRFDLVDEREDGQLSRPADDQNDIVLDVEASDALRHIVRNLAERHAGYVTDYELLDYSMRRLAANRKTTFDQFLADVRAHIGRAIVAVPVGGVFNPLGAIVPIGNNVLVGHLSNELELELEVRGRRIGLDGFRWNEDLWWTEELFAAEEDPELAKEIYESHLEDNTWPPLIVGVVVNRVGQYAGLEAADIVRSLLGACLLVLHSQERFWWYSPWIMGEPSLSDEPRSATLGEDAGLRADCQVVDTRPERSLRGEDITIAPAMVSDIDLADVLEVPNACRLLERVADSGARKGGDDTAVAEACRLIHAAWELPADAAIVLLERAAEIVVPDEQGHVPIRSGRQHLESINLRVKLLDQLRAALLPAVSDR